MRHLIVFLLLSFCIPCTYAQQAGGAVKDTTVYKMVDTPPSFNGDRNEFMANNLHYPEEAQRTQTEGTVLIEFIVLEDGTIDKVKIIRPSGSLDLDNEALRVIKVMPKWLPGKKNGVAVKCFYVYPISFSLH